MEREKIEKLIEDYAVMQARGAKAIAFHLVIEDLRGLLSELDAPAAPECVPPKIQMTFGVLLNALATAAMLNTTHSFDTYLARFKPLLEAFVEQAAPPEAAREAGEKAWSDWPGILAESIRCILKTKHEHAFKDAAYALEIYDEQRKKFGPIWSHTGSQISSAASAAPADREREALRKLPKMLRHGYDWVPLRDVEALLAAPPTAGEEKS